MLRQITHLFTAISGDHGVFIFRGKESYRTRCNISEDLNLYRHRCENLNSCKPQRVPAQISGTSRICSCLNVLLTPYFNAHFCIGCLSTRTAHYFPRIVFRRAEAMLTRCLSGNADGHAIWNSNSAIASISPPLNAFWFHSIVLVLFFCFPH